MNPSRQIEALARIPGLVHGFSPGSHPLRETRQTQRAHLARALWKSGRLHLLSQVHGADLRKAPWAGRPEGDAALALEPGVLLGVETADCVPLFLIDTTSRRVAAAHAGWRGTALGVAGVALQSLIDAGSRVGDIVAALGPAIGACCYEVGEDVVAAFGPEGRRFFVPRERGRPHLDLRAANVAQLANLGLDPGRIHHLDECTVCRAESYPSYRREGNTAGRIISFVGFEVG